jgi:hypothetical protein
VSGSQVTIPVRDAAGNETMRIVGDLTQAATGTGTTARATVSNIRMETTPRSQDLSRDDPRVGDVTASISAGLTRLPEGAKVTMTIKKELPPEARSGFELIARGAGNTIADVGAAVVIERQNLANLTDVRDVRIRIRVGADWVRAYGVENIKGTRVADDGTVEEVATTCTPVDGQYECELVSPKGFSIFALTAVAPIPAAFALTQLTIAPPVVRPGEPVEISAVVSNSGTSAGSYSAILSINGEPKASRSLTLEGGKQGVIRFFVVQAKEGHYDVAVDKLVGSFEVAVPLLPANISYSDLRVSPAEFRMGVDKAVTIRVKVSNSGDVGGKTDVELDINGAMAQIKPVVVPGKGSTDAVFEYTPPETGVYTVEINGTKGQFTAVRVLRPATFVLSGIKVEPAQVRPNEAVTVLVTVENTGELEGQRDVVLKIDGQEVDRATAVVPALTSLVVSFKVSRPVAGTFRVEVDGQTAQFVVAGIPVTPTATPTSTRVPTATPTVGPSPTPTQTPTPGVVTPPGKAFPIVIVIVVVVVVVVAGGAAAWFFLRRRPA